MKKIALHIITAIVLVFFIVILMAPEYLVPLRSYFIIHFLRTVLIIYLMSVLTNFFYVYIFKSNKIKDWLKNITLSVYVFVMLFFVVEIIFTFIPVSHTTSRTLAGANWFSFFWENNRMGYRDAELKEKNLAKKKIFFVGDSFTAGHGLKKCKQRFSDLAGEKLKGHYEFFNLGVNGADTDTEFDSLLKFPVKPDVLVLQYFFNDIDNASKHAGLWHEFPMAYQDIPLWQRPIVKGTYLFNFIYWKFPRTNEFDYVNYLREAYTDSSVLSEHLLSLKKFTDYGRTNGVKLYVVIIPFLQDLQTTKEFSAPIKQFFSNEKIEVIDVSDLVGDIAVKDRIVNRSDFHSSPLVNQRTADAIVNLVTQ